MIKNIVLKMRGFSLKGMCLPVFFLISQYGLAFGEIYIIANKSLHVDTLSMEDIQKIFLGSKTKLDQNIPIHFVIQQPGPPHMEFLKTYIKRDPEQFRNYWRRMLFTGNGNIPKAFKTESEILHYLSKNKNVISYVSKQPKKADIKIIRIEQEP